MKKKLLAVIFLVISIQAGFAQMVGTNIFLKGKYVEIGMNNNGSFGACTSAGAIPPGYHPHGSLPGELASVCDYGRDGWTVGTPPFMGDYTQAGGPFEGWMLQVAGARALAFQNCAGTVSSSGLSLSGSNVSYVNTGGAVIGYWSGTAAGGQLAIHKETRVDTAAAWVVVKVRLHNIGTTDLPDVYYFRSCDPDVDQTWPLGGFSTYNRITYQNDVEGRVLVCAKGTYPQAYLGLGTRDSRARVCLYPTWPLSASTNLSSVWHGTYGPALYSEGDAVTADDGIGLTFKLDTITAGDSAVFSYAYIFSDSTGLDSAFAPPCSGLPFAGVVSSSMPHACNTSAFTVSSSVYLAGITLQWQSSPDSISWVNISGATGLTYTSPGIAANTYYRCQVTCLESGLSSVSPGYKMLYMPCCTGAPATAVATASSLVCSSCVLTLALSGISPAGGILYQWQRSIDGVTFHDIYGGNVPAYTFTPPPEAAFYRCRLKCVSDGSIAYSTSVNVLYPYSIIQDSIALSPPAICVAPKFYVRANGISPLLRVKTLYGDGSSDSLSLMSSSGSSYIFVPHYYPAPGAYSVKHILYYNGVALDSIVRAFSYNYCRLIPVKFFKDNNSNCERDYLEDYNNIPISVRVDSSGIPIDTMEATGGFYYKALGLPGAVYQFTLLSAGPYISCAPLIVTIPAGSGSIETQYVGLTCSSLSGYDLRVYGAMRAHANRAFLDIIVNNAYCTPQSAELTTIFSPKYVFFSSSSALSASTANSMTHSFTLSYPFGQPLITARLNPSAGYLTVGDTVHTKYNITPIIYDGDTTNNNQEEVDTVRGPYDPNYVNVSPAGCFDTDGQELLYTVAFENTGNDTAHNIHVLDTLDANLDPQTLKPVAASAAMDIYQYSESGYNIVKFDFPGIMLPDSSHPEHCHGLFFFKIKTRQGLTVGTSVSKRVGIYFDYNEVVLTNSVTNTKGCPEVTAVRADVPARSSLFPNPAANELTITANETHTSFMITNAVGQSVMEQQLSCRRTTVSVKELPTGVYFVVLTGWQGRETLKFVKH